MSWEDRLKQAAFTSPSGTRYVFDYADVSRSTPKRTAAFDTPGGIGSYIQSNGRGSRQYPLVMYVSGTDYDLDAAALEEALAEEGEGTLEHPMYGALPVVVFGDVKRTDKLASGANQAAITATFWETTGVALPAAQSDARGDALEAVNTFNELCSEDFEASASLTSTVEQSELMGQYRAMLATVRDTLQPIADTQDDAMRTFDLIYSSLDEGLTTLVTSPATMVAQTQLLIQTAGKVPDNILGKVNSYLSTAASLITGSGTGATTGTDNAATNQFRAQDQFVCGAVVGMANTVAFTPADGYLSRSEALEVAETLLGTLDAATAWRDANFETLQDSSTMQATTSDAGDVLRGTTDTGGTYDGMVDVVSKAAGLLVQQSFSLRQEKRVALTEDRALVDVVFERYGDVDESLDFFINTNDLTGSEIMLLPKGREIVFYV